MRESELQKSMGARRFLAPGGTDYFGAPPSPFPYKYRSLKSRPPLNPATGSGSAVSYPSDVWGETPTANNFGALENLEMPLMTSKMCIVLCTCPFLPQHRSQSFFKIFCVAKNYRTPFRCPPLYWRPGALCLLPPTRRHRQKYFKLRAF